MKTSARTSFHNQSVREMKFLMFLIIIIGNLLGAFYETHKKKVSAIILLLDPNIHTVEEYLINIMAFT
jgi:hypothetical protein